MSARASQTWLLALSCFDSPQAVRARARAATASAMEVKGFMGGQESRAGPPGRWRPDRGEAGMPLRGHRLAVKRFLQLALGFLGQRGLEHRPAVLAQPVHGLVGRDLLDHDEQRRGAGLQHVADLLLELLVDAALLDLPEHRAQTGPYGHSEHRDEEQ